PRPSPSRPFDVLIPGIRFGIPPTGISGAGVESDRSRQPPPPTMKPSFERAQLNDPSDRFSAARQSRLSSMQPSASPIAFGANSEAKGRPRHSHWQSLENQPPRSLRLLIAETPRSGHLLR